MKKIILAAAATLSLGAGTAFAQGRPDEPMQPIYGSKAFSNQQYHEKSVFSEIFGKQKNRQTTAEQASDSRKGG
jgi:hypothetical protein